MELCFYMVGKGGSSEPLPRGTVVLAGFSSFSEDGILVEPVAQPY